MRQRFRIRATIKIRIRGKRQAGSARHRHPPHWRRTGNAAFTVTNTNGSEQPRTGVDAGDSHKWVCAVTTTVERSTMYLDVA